MTPEDSVSDRRPPPLGRRDFLGRVAAIGLGAGAAGELLPTVTAGAAVDTTQSASSSFSSTTTSPRSIPTR